MWSYINKKKLIKFFSRVKATPKKTPSKLKEFWKALDVNWYSRNDVLRAYFCSNFTINFSVSFASILRMAQNSCWVLNLWNFWKKNLRNKALCQILINLHDESLERHGYAQNPPKFVSSKSIFHFCTMGSRFGYKKAHGLTKGLL